jgi:hypothetical protein
VTGSTAQARQRPLRWRLPAQISVCDETVTLLAEPPRRRDVDLARIRTISGITAPDRNRDHNLDNQALLRLIVRLNRGIREMRIHTNQLRAPKRRVLAMALGSVGLLFAAPLLAGGDVDEISPAPASIGADVPVTYFGPAPSSVEPELIGPHQLLTAGKVDLTEGTVTLPLYQGVMKTTGKKVYYVLTDTNDAGIAAGLGLNYAAKLGFAANCKAARNGAQQSDGTIVFEQGTVDFSPEHSVTAGDAPNAFPPKAFTPGSVGDSDYSPLARIGGVVYNAPIVAFDVEPTQLEFCDGNPDFSKVHDKTAKICPSARTITLRLTTGFSFSRPVVYLSLDASAALPAALESATVAPALTDVLVGRDDSFTSGVERLFTFTNGPSNLPGEVNPQRQGLSSAIIDKGAALNVIGGIPTIATDYSPLWDLNVSEWTQAAIDNGYRSRVTDEFTILGLATRGWLTGPGGAPFGSSGFIVNCPIVMRLL